MTLTTDSARSFSVLLRYYRADRSQGLLAELAGCDQTTIGLLERGERGPSREMALKLAAGLGLGVGATDRLLYAAGLAPETDYQALYEDAVGPVDAPAKWCPKCQRTLPAGPRGRFSIDRSRPDGLAPHCKACEWDRQKALRRRSALGRAS
jgi:transcriptional regulator with XRE-family HTH domain